MNLQIDKKKIFTILLITAILAITPLMTARADPPGSPPYGAYAELIASDKGVLNYVGDKVDEILSFGVHVPGGQYGSFDVQYRTHIQAASKASIAAASAIGASFEYGSNKLIAVGGNGMRIANSYNGYTCSHTIVITGQQKQLTASHTSLGLIVTYKYVIRGYYWKHGWGCRDSKLPFVLDVSSHAFIYKTALSKNVNKG